MHLHSYRLHNFRRLRDVHIELAKDISIFVGANNSGKTSATQALQIFLAGRSEKLSLHDFSSQVWKQLNETGAAPEQQDATATLPVMLLDLWFEVTETDLQFVMPLLPSSAWEGKHVGIRVEFGALNAQETLQRFRAKKAATTAQVGALGAQVGTYIPWPRKLTAYLEKELHREYAFRYYVLDRAQCDNGFVPRAGYSPAELTGETKGASILDSLIQVDCLNAQRHLADPAADRAGGMGRSESLSRRMSRFYERKTTSLVKALAYIAAQHGKKLQLGRQQIACITFTEIAAAEIWRDVGNNPLIHVSTIHSFLWKVVRSFPNDICAWVARRINERIAELQAEASAFSARIRPRTRQKNAADIQRFQNQLVRIAAVPSFRYGVGSDYPKGILGHDDVIRLATTLLAERRLLRTLVAQQFPFIFVDESQDTFPAVVDVLKAIQAQSPEGFCLGFFGDPMQQIYTSGAGNIAVAEGWLRITKPENFRCSQAVLAVANGIRSTGDGLNQTGGRVVQVGGLPCPVGGSARIFILPADERRAERLNQVRDWIAVRNADESWRAANRLGVKMLVIVHRMAAMRLGFADLYSALNDKAPESFKAGFLDASAWPLSPFLSFIVPYSHALRNGREFEAMTLLRTHCPQLAKEALPKASLASLLASLRADSLKLVELMAPVSNTTTLELLRFIREKQLMTLDARVLAYLDDIPQPQAEQEGEDDDGESGRELAAMDAFLKCRAAQFWGYREYIDEQSPFSTQQGVKGAEFNRVLVVLDDEESKHFQFSYDRYWGVRALSDGDLKNQRVGKETVIERTRRLFYVCCTRAMTDLAVVFFSSDPALARDHVQRAGIFQDGAIHTLQDLAPAAAGVAGHMPSSAQLTDP
jgi:DNA helicase-2/ATP-dependent DNA helicase PcrA